VATGRKTVANRDQTMMRRQKLGEVRRRLGWTLIAALWLVPFAVAGEENRLFAQLQQALRGEATESLQSLLAQGLDPNATDEQGTPLLIWAAARGNLALVDSLLQAGANRNRRNVVGETALMVAAYRGHLPVVEHLIAAGAIVDHDGWNPLLYAAMQGHVAVVDRLLAAGANPNRAAANGMTPLLWAAKNGDVAVVTRLLTAGADTEAVNEEGRGALVLALTNGHMEVAQRIEAERQKRGLPPARIALGIE